MVSHIVKCRETEYVYVICTCTHYPNIHQKTTKTSRCDLPIYDTVGGHAMLLAWSDDVNETDVNLHYHGLNRGSTILPFSAPPQSNSRRLKTSGALENTYSFELTAPPIYMADMPGFETCSYHTLPIDPTKGYHITKVEYIPNWAKGGAAERGMSHHSTLIALSNGVPEGHNWQEGELLPPIDGYDPIDNCHDMGGHDGDLVPQVLYIDSDEGVYFGNDRAIGVILLRHFYNDAANPKHLTGAPDIGTKWRITYTDQLRPKTLGKFHMQTTAITIPAKTNNHKIQIFCNGDDLAVFGSILLTGVNLHAHDRTSDTIAIYLRHFRNGVELEPIAIDEDFREATSDEGEYPLNRMLKADDSLLLECVYDNPTDDTIVWGSGINNQMCVANFQFVSDGVGGLLSCQENYRGGAEWPSDPGYYFFAQGYDSTIGSVSTFYTVEERQAILDALVPYDGTVDKCDGTDDWWLDEDSEESAAAGYKIPFVFIILVSYQMF